jgi:hypothetical protein
MIGEIGGTAEEEAAELIKASGTSKPILSFIAGVLPPSVSSSLQNWAQGLRAEGWEYNVSGRLGNQSVPGQGQLACAPYCKASLSSISLLHCTYRGMQLIHAGTGKA